MPGSEHITVILPEQVRMLNFPWGSIRMLCDARTSLAKNLSFGVVESSPGGSHERHCHPESEEVIHIISGDGELHTDTDAPCRLGPGATIYVPAGCMHTVVNIGSDVLRIIIVYSPPLPLDTLSALPGCTITEPPSLTLTHVSIPIAPQPIPQDQP